MLILHTKRTTVSANNHIKWGNFCKVSLPSTTQLILTASTTCTNLTMSPPITSTATTAPIGGKRGKLKGFELYHTDYCMHEQQVFNQATRTNNGYILTIKRAKLLVYGYVRDAQSLSMDIAGIIGKYYANNYSDIDIRHPDFASYGKRHSQAFSTILLRLDGVSMSSGKGYLSKIIFSIELLGKSKCKMDNYCVSMWCRGYSKGALKRKNGDGNVEYYAINDFFANILKRGEIKVDYVVSIIFGVVGLPEDSEIYLKIDGLFDVAFSSKAGTYLYQEK